MTEELPEGWAMATMAEVGQLYCGQSPPSAAVNRSGHGEPYVSGPEQWADGRLHLAKWTTSPKRLVPEGCIFITVKGAGVGATFRGIRCAIGRDIYAFDSAPGLNSKYLHLALDFGIRSLITRAAGLIPGLSREHILQQPVPLPPSTEQRRIVETVEALLGQLSTARARLAKAPLILKRFRQSVLAAACTGKLTEDWRAKGYNAVAPARLLESIREARLRAWEAAERRKIAIRGRTITDAELRARYRLPAEAEAAFETPAAWTWATLDELTLLAGGLTKGQKRQVGARLRTVPYLRVANVQRGHLDLTRIKSIPATEDEINDLRLEDGDILLNEGGDIDKLGRGWVWHGEVGECIHQNHVFRARPASTLVEPHFVSHYANTFGQRFFFDAGSQTVNLASVSMSKIRGLPVPVPPLDEQREILRRVNALFGLADTIERRVAAASARGDVLTQSVLAKAFRGELVPTEADVARAEGREYESAPALLARIQTERARTDKPSKDQRGGALRASART